MFKHEDLPKSNFQPFEVVVRFSETQLQVSENLLSGKFTIRENANIYSRFYELCMTQKL